MAIPYKTVAKGEPGIKGGGNRKYYASNTRRSKISLENIASEISDMSTLTPMDVQAVIVALIELMPKYLNDGMQVDLGNLGSFYASIQSHAETAPNKVDKYSIKKVKPVFIPSKLFQTRLNKARFKKVK